MKAINDGNDGCDQNYMTLLYMCYVTYSRFMKAPNESNDRDAQS